MPARYLSVSASCAPPACFMSRCAREVATIVAARSRDGFALRADSDRAGHSLHALGGPGQALGERALPFYYGADFAAPWNVDALLQCAPDQPPTITATRKLRSQSISPDGPLSGRRPTRSKARGCRDGPRNYAPITISRSRFSRSRSRMILTASSCLRSASSISSRSFTSTRSTSSFAFGMSHRLPPW